MNKYRGVRTANLTMSLGETYLAVRNRVLRVPWLRVPLRRVIHSQIGSLPRTLINRILARSGELEWTETPEGWMCLYRNWERGYATGDVERDTTTALASLVRPGMHVYDIGAHAGYYSLFVVQRIGAGKLLAVEADPTNARRCHEAFERNGVDAQVLHAAVYSSTGTIQFHCSAGGRMSGAIHPGRYTLGVAEAVEVPAVTIDSLAQRYFPPDLIKIDIEGGELEALLGAESVLRAVRPILLIEVHSAELAAQVQELLAGFGYSFEPLAVQAYPRHFWARAGLRP